MIDQMDRLKNFFGQEKTVSWERVFTRELPRILNYFRFHGVEESVAEDLAASTFEKAWRAKHSYSSEKSALSTWLYTIARNTLIDHYRSKNGEVPLELLDDLTERPVYLSMEEAAQIANEKERLRQLLTRLPEREREIVALKYGAEWTNRSIAKHTGLSESNVGTILNRVVGSLRRKMEEESER